MVYTIISKLLLIISLLFSVALCEKANTTPAVQAVETDSTAPLKIRFNTANGGIEYRLNPEDQDIYITVNTKSVTNSEFESLNNDSSNTDKDNEHNLVDSIALSKMTSKELTEKVLANLRKAQEAFYKNDYDQALEYTNKSLDLKKTAEGFALEGSIYYMQDKLQEAQISWNKALQINPDIPGVMDMLKRINKE